MTEFNLRADDVEVVGKVVSAWVEPFGAGQQGPGTWHVVLQLTPNSPALVATDGRVNAFDWLECQVTPVSPYRDEPRASRLLAELAGCTVRLSGSWGDVIEGGANGGTLVLPIAWIVVDRGITPIIEEHGFSQAVRDVDVFAFSDDSPTALGVAPPPHHGEDRHVEIEIPFPFRPQSNAVPTSVECVDREDHELVLYGLRSTSNPSFPVHRDRQHNIAVATNQSSDVLRVTIDTGTPAAGAGFFYTKLVLTYDEAFDTMCDTDICLTDPGRSCQATSEKRLSYEWPRMAAVLAGDLLLGPAGGSGVLGRLLGALAPAQRYDHMVIFVEDDGRSVRHCTASDDRIANEAYYSSVVTLKTPFGSVDKRLPLQGIREDVLRFAWPGAINQTIGEVCLTGHNRSNPQFAFSTLYPEVIKSEIGDPPLLWQLAPAERAKRTAFHDPEAAGTAKRERDASSRDWYELVKLQKDPAFRGEIDKNTGQVVSWIHPVLIKPNPFLAGAAREPLRMVAAQSKRLSAHYRFFSYTDATIAVNPAFDAPPLGAWGPNAGRDWPASTKAAVCSSFVWAAVQAANPLLQSAGLPRIELEGQGEPEDERPAADIDGLYHYTAEERVAAAKALFSFTHDRVSGEVDKAIADLPDLVATLLDVFPGAAIVDDTKNLLASIVANQLCNTFAADSVGDVGSTWSGTKAGVAVSPDDTQLRWDVRAPSMPGPPPISPGKIKVYGNPQSIVVPRPGWRLSPIYRVRASKGKGSVRGTVVGRLPPKHRLTEIIGATVRMGCEATATTLIEGKIGFEFLNTKAGRYRLQAAQFVLNPTVNAAQEWKSEVVEVELRDGDDQRGIVLELVPPPGVARTLDIRSHHDIVDRVVIGKDRWGHPDMNGKVDLAFDPLDVEDAPPEQKNTSLSATWDRTTPGVGSDVYVRVIVDASLNSSVAADGTMSFDGSITCDVRIILFDAGEGETNGTVEDLGIVLRLGDAPHDTPYNMVSNDTVPERASGVVTITNLLTSLP